MGGHWVAMYYTWAHFMYVCTDHSIRSHGWYTRWEENICTYTYDGAAAEVYGWTRIAKARQNTVEYIREVLAIHIYTPPSPHSCRMAECLHRTDIGKHDHGFLTKEYYILYIVCWPFYVCTARVRPTYMHAYRILWLYTTTHMCVEGRD